MFAQHFARSLELMGEKMKSQRLIASTLLLLLIGIAPMAAHAVCVRLNWTNVDGSAGFAYLPQDCLSSEAPFTGTVFLDSSNPVGAPATYGPFRIEKCPACLGRPRIEAIEGDIARLVLTDARIINTVGGVATRTLFIEAFHQFPNASGPGGTYPYIAETSGRITGTLATALNQVRVKASACRPDPFGGGDIIILDSAAVIVPLPGSISVIPRDLVCPLIDQPVNDMLDDGTVSNGQLSISVPPFLTSVGNFGAPPEDQLLQCDGYETESSSDDSECRPALALQIAFTLKPNTSLSTLGSGVNLPGSIGLTHIPAQCEPENGLVEGCERLADEVARLRPKGAKFYNVRLEPSAGGSNREYRGYSNSFEAWKTRRDLRDDEDLGAGVGLEMSATTARLDTSGTGEVRAKGLCPVEACSQTGPELMVKVFCGSMEVAAPTLKLDGKGDGQVDILTPFSCSDPGILIMDPDGDAWVAAPTLR
jgi:hypothetical protein